MGIFDWLFGKRQLEPAEGPVVDASSGDFWLEIVGESRYQEALRRVFRGYGAPVKVYMSHEPNNPYDKNAVKVTNAHGETIGYLSREMAQELGPTFAVARRSGTIITCQAKLYDGGEGSEKRIGAWLDLKLVFDIDGQDTLGLYRGRHRTDYFEMVVAALKRAKRLEAARELLYGLLDTVEEEAKSGQRPQGKVGVDPWPYKQLAIIHRKLRERDEEIAVLERYFTQAGDSGHLGGELRERYEKLVRVTGR